MAGRKKARFGETLVRCFLFNAKLQNNHFLVSAIISVLSNFGMYANVAMGKILTGN